MDIWDKQKRSEVMSKIRSKNTKPEIKLRKALFAQGFRYRINYKRLAGSPDIVFHKYKTVIFVQGCFWHGHHQCRLSHLPKSNTEFWKNKIEKNKQRDKDIKLNLIVSGWRVIEVWECEIRTKNKLKLVVGKICTCLRNLEESPQKRVVHIQIYDEFDNDIKIVAEDKVQYNNRI